MIPYKDIEELNNLARIMLWLHPTAEQKPTIVKLANYYSNEIDKFSEFEAKYPDTYYKIKHYEELY